MAKKHKNFKLNTKQNEMGIFMFALVAVIVGVLIGSYLMYTGSGNAVLGVMTP